MKYVFFGSPRFAAIVLEGLITAGMPPVAIVCNPDRPTGRKKIITPPPAKEIGEREKISVFQPEILDENFIKILTEVRADLFVVAAYAKIIQKGVLAIPRFGTLGTHPSLLPKYRGASPIQSAILRGEEQTGTTIYGMDEKMDHGPIFKAASVALDSLTTQYSELEKTLATLSAQLLATVIPSLSRGTLRPDPQDDAQATYTKKFVTADGFVPEKDLSAAIRGNTKEAERILRMINAFTPEPGCWTVQDGLRKKLLQAKIQNGALTLLITQQEGQKPIRQ